MSLIKEQTTHNFEWLKPVSKWQALLLSFPIHVKRTESSSKSQSKKGNLHAHKRKNNYPSIMKEVYTKKSNKMDELEMQNKTNR